MEKVFTLKELEALKENGNIVRTFERTFYNGVCVYEVV